VRAARILARAGPRSSCVAISAMRRVCSNVRAATVTSSCVH
jgi:hypothetical protein